LQNVGQLFRIDAVAGRVEVVAGRGVEGNVDLDGDRDNFGNGAGYRAAVVRESDCPVNNLFPRLRERGEQNPALLLDRAELRGGGQDGGRGDEDEGGRDVAVHGRDSQRFDGDHSRGERSVSTPRTRRLHTCRRSRLRRTPNACSGSRETSEAPAGGSLTTSATQRGSVL